MGYDGILCYALVMNNVNIGWTDSNLSWGHILNLHRHIKLQ
jgi:hypothetical protein